MAWVSLITTGGTIAAQRVKENGHVVVNITGDKLRAAVQDTPTGIEIKVDDFLSIASFAMTLELAFSLAARINLHLSHEDCLGVVVTHGTDTMEETAYLADLVLTSSKPVVFTGAQRGADDLAGDGPRNVSDAVKLAASPLAYGLGAVIMFEQQFHTARDVTKSHTSRVDAFISRNHGKLGEIDGSVVSVSRHPVFRKAYSVDKIEPRVELIKMVMGSDDRLIRYLAASGAKAIILEGFGRGNTPPSVTAAVKDIVADGVPVVVTSRCGDGRVRPIYGNGGGKDLERAGAIFAGDLAGLKARILLAVLLGKGMTVDEIRREIEEIGG
jgi:L-asparaginase